MKLPKNVYADGHWTVAELRAAMKGIKPKKKVTFIIAVNKPTRRRKSKTSRL